MKHSAQKQREQILIGTTIQRILLVVEERNATTSELRKNLLDARAQGAQDVLTAITKWREWEMREEIAQ